MTNLSGVMRQRPSLTLSPDAVAILEDYGRFLQDIWDSPPASPDAVLAGSAIQVMLVSKRSPATHRTNRAFLCFALSRALPRSHYPRRDRGTRPSP